MASKENKVIRRAQAMAEMARLSQLLAEHFNITLPQTQSHAKDNELAEIQRIEGINSLLDQVLQASNVNTEPLASLTKAQLLEKAAEQEVEVSKSATKAEIIAALEQNAANN
jgi:hypothetical protein